MDVGYFLRQRMNFIKFYYDTAIISFLDVQDRIENEKPPFDNPPYSEDPEPAFLQEWIDAENGKEILGLSCVSMLSDSLKLYFEALKKNIIGFSFRKDPRGRDFLEAYKIVLSEVFSEKWDECPAKFELFEQVILARNRHQHGSYIVVDHIRHDPNTLQKHPSPFFANPEEVTAWKEAGGDPNALLVPQITVNRKSLFNAIDEVVIFSNWIDDNINLVWAWRQNG